MLCLILWTALIAMGYAGQNPPGGRVEVLHVRGPIYMIDAGGVNITASIGPDGVLLADTGPEDLAKEVLATIRDIQKQLGRHPKSQPVGGAETRMATQALFTPLPPVELGHIRYILNTSAHADHRGGNPTMAVVPRRFSSQDPGETATKVHAHENVLLRLSGAVEGEPAVPYEFWPSDVYFEDQYKLPYFNGEGVQLIHVKSGSTDGDSIVWFRGSDVISAGDIYRTDAYPLPYLEKGGSIQGVIEGLNVLLDLVIPEYRAEGGTLVIPGHGRISDQGDVANYRDMVTIIRDRIQHLMKKGLTLEQIKAARPMADYDPRYAREAGSSERFIEAVYRGLTR
jgi:cyclase